MQSVYDNLVELHAEYDLSLTKLTPVFIRQYGLKIAGFAVIGYTAYKIYKWPRNLPPGPRNWPVQTAIKTPEAMHLDFVRLGQKYGDIFSFYYGSK